MKKLVVVFGLLAIVSGVMFAQELKFDGYLNSGLGVIANNNEDDDAFLKAFGVDSESNGYRFRLNGSYQNEAKTAGARFRLQSQRNLSAGVFSLAYAYGWVNFLDNKMSLTGGIVDDGTWATADWWFNDDTGEGLGLLLKATPIDGLNIGVGAYIMSQQSGGSNNALTYNGSLPNFGNVRPKLDEAKYNFNVSYTMPDTFRFGASFRTKNKAAWAAVAEGADYAYAGNYEPSQLIAEFRFLGVKDLSAIVAGIFDNLDDFSDRGNIRLSETFGYKINSDISAGLNAVQFLYNRGDTDMNPGLLFNLWGTYALGSIVPRVDAVYFMGGRSLMATSTGTWHRKGFENVARTKDEERDLSVFSIRPSVKFNLDGRTFVEIGDVINFDSGNYDGAYANPGDAANKSRMTNVFYIDVKWSF